MPVIFSVQNLDLQNKKLVHDGPLTWRINRAKSIGKANRVLLSTKSQQDLNCGPANSRHLYITAKIGRNPITLSRTDVFVVP